MMMQLKIAPVLISILIFNTAILPNLYTQNSNSVFHEEDLTIRHNSNQELGLSNLKSTGLFINVDNLTKNKKSMWSNATIEKRNNEFHNKTSKIINSQSLILEISHENKVLSLEIKDDTYSLVYQDLEFKVECSFSELIKKLNDKNIFYRESKRYDSIEIPFMYENMVNGKTRIVASSRSILIYYERIQNCIESIRIVEWD
jgi:hypothetical protein